MTESLNTAREDLAKIVDRLAAENPEIVEQYAKVFADDDATAGQWISYGITQSDSLGAAESAPAPAAEESVPDPVAEEEWESISVDPFTDEDFLDEEFECEDPDVEMVG